MICLETTLIYAFLFLFVLFYINFVKSQNNKAAERKSYDFDILKRGYSTKATPANVDVIVIGSGIGGLSSASLLAQRGYKVLVLEQHDVVGGNMHTFEEKGYEFDTGIHYVGECGSKSSPIQKMMASISDSNPVQWEPMNDHFDVAAVVDATRLTEKFEIHKNFKRMEEELIAEFPAEKEAIEKYCKLLLDVDSKSKFFFAIAFLPSILSKPLLRLWRWAFPITARAIDHTSLEIISELTSNTKLIGVLCYLYGNSGLRPSVMSFFHHAIIVRHYVGGGFYPVGGSVEIVKPIVRKILSLNGTVLVRAPVSEILIDNNGKAYGVKVKDKEILSKYVISSAGAINTYKKLINEKHSSRISHQIELIDKLTPSTSFCSLFVGIKNEDKIDLKLPKQNFWVFPSWKHEDNNDISDNDSTSLLPGAFLSFPSSKDPTWQSRHPGKEVCVLVAMTEYKFYEKYRNERVKNRGDEYEKIKASLQDRMLAVVYKIAPQIKGKVDYIDAGTPITNDFYLGTACGESYGLMHTPLRFQNFNLVGPKTPIKNLVLAGHDCFTNGFAGALFGGYVAAMEMDRSIALTNIIDIM